MPDVPAPDMQHRTAAAAHLDRLTKPPGSLGRLEELVVWAAGVQSRTPPLPFAAVRLVIFAGDHGVARAARTSAYPPEVTAQMVANFVAGGAAANVLAERVGATVRVVDAGVDSDYDGLDVPESVRQHRVRRSSGSLDRQDALTAEQAGAAVALGARIADEEVDSGADLLIVGDMGIGNTTPAAVLIAAVTGADAVSVCGRGTGIDDPTWMRKAAAIRDGLWRVQDAGSDPLLLLQRVAGADLAAMVGFLVRAAERRTPVLLDGVVVTSAALVAAELAPGAPHWWQAGHLSVEPAHRLALDRLQLEPLLQLSMRLGEGSGALVALPVLQAALAAASEMATFAEAGVSESDASSGGHDVPR
jgi:nicotinate-nucleotide--dimethylbenzimidazole phosphoribosyltransferase